MIYVGMWLVIYIIFALAANLNQVMFFLCCTLLPVATSMILVAVFGDTLTGVITFVALAAALVYVFTGDSV